MSLVPHSIFSTDDLPECDRFEAWRALFAGYDVEANPNGFSGRIETTQIGSMLLHVMNASPQQTGRTRSGIRQDGQERFTVLLSQHHYHIESERGTADVPSGLFSFNDMSQPYRRTKSRETNSIILSLSRDSVAKLLPDDGALHGLVLLGSDGFLLSEYLRGLLAQRRAIQTVQAVDVAQATLHLLAASARPTRDRMAIASGPAKAARLSIVKRYIRRNLSKPITAETIASAQGLSRSRLYALFESEGGVNRYLVHQRLEAVKVALDDPQDGRPIGVIGAENGLINQAHLSRAFRDAYGQSPRDYRANRNFSAEQKMDERPSIATWLRALG